jgi:hypothetical protein
MDAKSAQAGRGEARRLTLKEFLADEAQTVSIGARFNGGTFMQCHTAVFAETGIWIEELVPVFQRLDAQLANITARKVEVLSPDLA